MNALDPTLRITALDELVRVLTYVNAAKSSRFLANLSLSSFLSFNLSISLTLHENDRIKKNILSNVISMQSPL